MKKSEVKNIVTDKPLEDCKEPKLVFTRRIYENNGENGPPAYQPEDWDNVRHLTGNLYLAWDKDAPFDGCVYIGEFF